MESTKHKNFYSIGVSYIKADAQTRGKFSLAADDKIALLNEAKSNDFEGVFVLSTCNRTEIIGFAEHPLQLMSLLC